MALEDRDLFNAIFNKYSDQPIEFVMAQYEKAKLINLGIEQRQSSRSYIDVTPNGIQQGIEEFKQNQVSGSSVPEKKYKKSDLVITPDEAITDDSIKCCICKKEYSSLTSRHLGTHGISVESYKTLCGYDRNQKLMSNNHAKHMCENAKKAQAARSIKIEERKTPKITIYPQNQTNSSTTE